VICPDEKKNLVTIGYYGLPWVNDNDNVRLPCLKSRERLEVDLHFFTSGLLHENQLADKGKVWGHLVPEIAEKA
jgi:hypothetical protein